MTSILVSVLGAAVVCAGIWSWFVRFHTNTIQQLQELPVNSVIHLRGVVIDEDEGGDRFWMQDGTGVIPIAVSPARAGVHAGESVSIEAKIVSSDHGPSLNSNDSTSPKAHVPATQRRLPAASSAAPASSAARKSEMSTQKAGSVPSVRNSAGSVSIVNAAPDVSLAVAKIEQDSSQRVTLALFAFFLVWLSIVYRWMRRQRVLLGKTSDTTHALRELSTAVQRLTREGVFNSEVAVHGDPDVAPLAIGFNAMLAEVLRQERARKEAESRLQHWALIDDLTGLPNRRLLSDRLSQSITKAQRDQKLLALLCINLDGFKLVNDSFGHPAGDALLAQVAQRLKARFRRSDTLARIGGDEFALILDNLEHRSDAQKAGESLLEYLKPAFEIDGHSIRIGASIGISIFADGNERGQLLQQADCAMDAAKRNGKGCVVEFVDGLGGAARERLTLEGELHHAIANGEIFLHYQPEYDLATDTIVRFEALVRWKHPRLGQMMPVNFIPVAEESGLIIPLGAYIMERACTDARAWQEIANRPIEVAVNVSTLQFARDSFFEEVADILHRTGLHPGLLQIELTETATVAGIDRAAEMMRRLKRLGVSVAVDDFGTGYSCLSYLPKLSFDSLKLDRSFVNDLVQSRETRLFVKSILALAGNLHMKVIVEGVETREQLSLIRSMGANEAQGYLLGRPVPDPIALLCQEPSDLISKQEDRVEKDGEICMRRNL
jgi:diguanylate cyclase (GGDEF)-like protein